MKKVLLLLLLAMAVVLGSCYNTVFEESESDISSETEKGFETIIPDYHSNVTNSVYSEESAIVSSYEVNPYNSDCSFDMVMNVCLNSAGIEGFVIGETYDGSSDYQPYYETDHSVVIDELCEEDDLGMQTYYPKEYEYHMRDYFYIDGLWTYVIGFDNPEWAEIGFMAGVNDNNTSDSSVLCDNCVSGYYFINKDSKFTAVYLFDGFYFKYIFFYNQGNDEQYQIYLDICEELGLPTCDEVTEDIMGSSN